MTPQIDVDFGKADAAKPRAKLFIPFARIGGEPPDLPRSQRVLCSGSGPCGMTPLYDIISILYGHGLPLPSMIG